MELNLPSPQPADKKIFEGAGGSFYSWSSSKISLLSEAKVGAGRLVLYPRAFALPHYSDSSKIGYVIEGSCTVGIVLPGTSNEKVVVIKKGDAIVVPFGATSWWFNGGDSEVVIVFIGETSKGYNPGEFTYFFLTGTLGVLRGLSTELISKCFHLSHEEANKLTTSQTGTLIIKLDQDGILSMPQPCMDGRDGIVVRLDNASPDSLITNVEGGAMPSAKFALPGQQGLSAMLLKMGANAVWTPTYTTQATVQVFYIIKGSGRVQVVGLDGKRVLDTNVQAGQLFVVPWLFVLVGIANEEGIECLKVMTSAKIEFENLVGSTSVWKALSPTVLETALNVTPKFANLFLSKNAN